MWGFAIGRKSGCVHFSLKISKLRARNVSDGVVDADSMKVLALERKMKAEEAEEAAEEEAVEALTAPLPKGEVGIIQKILEHK